MSCLTSVPVAVCGCLASSPHRSDTSTIWPGRSGWEPRGRRRPAVSRLDLPPLAECSLDWCNLQNWRRRRIMKLKSVVRRTLVLRRTSPVVIYYFLRKAKILMWRHQNCWSKTNSLLRSQSCDSTIQPYCTQTNESKFLALMWDLCARDLA